MMSPIQQHTQEKQTRDGKSLEIQTCHTAHYFHFLKTRGKLAALKTSRSIAHKLDGFWLQFRGADLSPKFPLALRGALGVKSLTSSGHLVHDPSLQEFHRCQVSQC